MADIVPTVKVKPWGQGQGDFVEVNVSDFDPKAHTPFDAEEAAKVGITEAKGDPEKGDPEKGEGDDDDTGEGQGAMKISEIRAALTAKGIDFDPKAKKAELRALLEAQG